MSELLSGILSNDSAFGKVMTRLGIIIAVNILFVLCTLPVVTIGVGFAAMYYAFMRCLRGDGQINPFKEFFKGFKTNFKQATISWIVGLALLVFLYLEYFWCGQFGGIFLYFRFGLLAIAMIVVLILVYIFPVMAAFNGKLADHIKSAIFFAFKKPLSMILILAANICPLLLTYLDERNMPLYGFLWVVCGFGVIGMFTSSLLLKEFKPFLPMVDSAGDIILNPEDEEEWADGVSEGYEGMEKSEWEILEEMKKLGM